MSKQSTTDSSLSCNPTDPLPRSERESGNGSPGEPSPEASRPSSKITALPAVDNVGVPWRRTAALVMTDALAVGASLAVGFALAGALEGTMPGMPDYRVSAAVVLFSVLGYALAGLYHGIPPAPVSEMRVLGFMTTVVFAAPVIVAGLMLDRQTFPLLPLVFSWVTAILVVLLTRAFLRHLCAHRSWWQCSVVVLGAGRVGRRIVRTLIGQPERGLRPVAMVDDNREHHGDTVEGVPVVGHLARATYFSREGVPYAIAELPTSKDRENARRIEFCTSGFRSVLFVSRHFSELPNRWARAHSLGTVAGLELPQRLRSAWRRHLKRAFDVAVALALGLATLPMGALAALLIKLDSEGPVFYRQTRLGRGGRRFEVLKFRSMYTGAEERLQEVLENDPEARAEFDNFQKLSDDPRVTRVGDMLRKTSMDELPQLWNVLKGDMSMVGPRAYLPEELPKMKRLENLILRATPGITGLWQVSGRNQLSFEARLELEASYVRNWSFFYDLYLLIRTIPVVLLGRGAQ